MCVLVYWRTNHPKSPLIGLRMRGKAQQQARKQMTVVMRRVWKMPSWKSDRS